MSDPTALFTLASAGTLGIAIAAAAALRGWQGWLDIKRLQIDGSRPAAPRGAPPRIEIADLRDRVRRLEAIANGSEG